MRSSSSLFRGDLTPTAPPTKGILMEKLVKLINADTRDFAFPYGNAWEMVEIPAGGEKIVPWSVACAFSGDPTITNKSYWEERTECHERLMAFTGEWNLEVHDLEGRRITMVRDDPDGTTLTPQAGTDSDVGLLQAQIEQLQARMNELAAGNSTPVDASDIPTDEPSKVPVSKARRG